MRIETKVEDLKKYLNKTEAVKAYSTLLDRLPSFANPLIPEEKRRGAMEETTKANAARIEAEALFAKVPAERRNLAEATWKFAEALNKTTIPYTGYSGDEAQGLGWTELCANVSTTISKGDAYSRRCKYKKTDAFHLTLFNLAGLIGVYENLDIAAASRQDGLPLISYNPSNGAAVWVETARKRHSSVQGWIFYDPETRLCFHSDRSAEHAQNGLKRKVKKHTALQKEEARAAAELAEASKAIVEAKEIFATVQEARAFGYCSPGIREFQAKHNLGDTVSLADLAATGDARAQRLAVTLWRKHNSATTQTQTK